MAAAITRALAGDSQTWPSKAPCRGMLVLPCACMVVPGLLVRFVVLLLLVILEHRTLAKAQLLDTVDLASSSRRAPAPSVSSGPVRKTSKSGPTQSTRSASSSSSAWLGRRL